MALNRREERKMAGYAIGDRVSHGQYGDGTVMRVDQYHTVIQFDAHGTRTFSSPLVVLTSATTVAPAKPRGGRKVARRSTTP
jgi:hypothetical protein